MKTKAVLLSLAVVGLAAGAARANFTVTGTFRYVDRPFTFSGGFSAAETNLPIRLARVQVIDDQTGAALATSSTAQDGSISIAVGGTGTRDILVRCYARSDAFGSNRLRVTTQGGTLYSVSSQVFAGWDLSTNLNIGTVTAQKVFSGSNQGGPFNILDQMVAGTEYAKSAGAPNPPVNLRGNWPGGSGSFASGTQFFMADDDGFDDMVVLHEFGHVLHNVYSDSDSPGGSHSFAQSDQDPRLSYSEGWASFFAGAVRQHQGIFDPAFYMDCFGQGQTGSGSVQLRMRMENGSPFATGTGGEADEGAVFCVLWDLVDTASTNDGNATDDDAVDGSFTFAGGLDADQMQWAVFTGPVAQASNLTIRDQWNGTFSPTNHGQHAAVESVFNGWQMRFLEDTGEPNDTTGSATPLALGTSWGPTRTLYSSNANPPAPGDGDLDHYAIDLQFLDVFEVETRYPGGVGDAETYCDPRITLFRPDGTQFAQNDDGGTGRNARLTNQVADQTGTWIVRVDTTHAYRRTGSYQLRARVLIPAPCGSTPYGAGEVGSTGTTATISTTGNPANGQTIAIRLAGGNPNSFCVLFEGANVGNNVQPWGTILVAGPAFFRTYTSTDAAGNASVLVPVDAALAGQTRYYQYAVRDPGFGGNIQASGGLQIDYCP